MLEPRALVLVVDGPVVHDLVGAALEDEADKRLQLEQCVSGVVRVRSSL